MTLESALDGLLAVALPLMAWRVLAEPELNASIVLFIAFGLLSALIWARLDAPDVALVEAAVGAGLTGALLMSALRFFAQPPKLSAWRVRTIPCFAIVMACGLLTAVSRLPSTAAGLGPDVIAREQQSGGFQPVTAVLMNFRGYDTHLEMVVLLVAAIGVHSLKRERAASITEPSPLLPALVALIVPASIIVAGYLVWRGSHAPGGAFQAGAILAGAAVLLRLSHRLPPLGPDSPVIRLTLVFGPMLFLGLAIAPLLSGRSMLEYPRDAVGGLILALESALTLSIATILSMFLPDERPA